MPNAFDDVFAQLETGRINVLPPKLDPALNLLLDIGVSGQDTEAGSNSGASGNTQVDSTNLRKLNRTDGICFLTGLPHASMHAAHLVNALRTPPPRAPEGHLKTVKDQLNKYLTALEFNRGQAFHIDKRPNLLLLLQTLHSDLDNYGAFAFIPTLPGLEPKDYLDKLAALLLSCNQDWQKRYEVSNSAPRDLPFHNELLDMTKVVWIVLVLKPRVVSPYNFGTLVCKPEHRPTTYTPDLPPDAAAMAHLFVKPKFGLTLGTSNSVQLLQAPQTLSNEGMTPLYLQAPTTRRDADMLSLFAMIINAHSKVEAYVTKNRNHQIVEIPGQLSLVRDRIFFAPGKELFKALLTTVKPAVPAIPPVPQSSTQQGGQTSQPSTRSHSSSGKNQQSPGDRTSARPERGSQHRDAGDPTLSAEDEWSLGEADSSEEEESEDEGLADNDEEGNKVKNLEVVPGITLDEYQTLLESVGDDSVPLTTPEIFSMLLFGAQGFPTFKEPPPLEP
ncbi:HNHc domain-containing protein [Mycena kentingensis (nom. inval.)]|nr:HNHc domain-containing protein [Mycena kentingensis (nom. inval.)]